jgi:hypothetical protein
MRRRTFLRDLAVGAAGVTWMASRARTASAADSKQAERFKLSDHGCGRATGYAETNKIITLGDKTHVAWLDSQDKGFHVRVRTLDRPTGRWSPTYTVGKAFDNHGGPALAADSKGHLHIVYYPHHHPFRYRRSTRPNDASQWEAEVQFGKRCTYPTLVVGRDDTLYLTCRESSKTEPWVVNLYVKRPDGGWRGPRTIMKASGPAYAHFQEALAWGPDHRTLHLSTRMYRGTAHTVAYMQSADLGKTWRRFDGRPIKLPATSSTIDVIAQNHTKRDLGYRCGSIAVDAAGTPHVLYSQIRPHPPGVWIATPGKNGEWHKRSLVPDVAKALPGWFATMPGGMAFGKDRRIFVALTVTPIDLLKNPEYKAWGNSQHEVLWLESCDRGKTFAGKMVSKLDSTRAHWLPNVERPTGHNQVGVPGLIYTAGGPGEKNTQVVSNGVHWVG